MSDHRPPTNLEVLKRMREQLSDIIENLAGVPPSTPRVKGEMKLQLDALDYAITCVEMVDAGKC